MRNRLIVTVGSDTVSDTVVSHPGTADDLAAGTLAVFLAEHPDTDPASIAVTATPYDRFDGHGAEEPVTATTTSHPWITPKWVDTLTGYIRMKRRGLDPAALMVLELTGTPARATAPRDLPWPAWDMTRATRTAWSYVDPARGHRGEPDALTDVEAERVVWAADEIANTLYRAAQVVPSGRASRLDRTAFPDLAWTEEAHELAAAVDDLHAGAFTRGKAQRAADAAGAVREIAVRKLRRAHAEQSLFVQVDEVRLRGMAATAPYAGATDPAGRYAALVLLHDGLEELAALLQDDGAHAEPVGEAGPWYLSAGGSIDTAIREGLRELYVWTGREEPGSGSTLDRAALATNAVRLRDALEWELARIEDRGHAAGAARG